MPDDQQLVGDYWRLDELDELTNAERARLLIYWRKTHLFGKQSEELLASPRPLDQEAAQGLLLSWSVAWNQLRDWHHLANYQRSGDHRNPVSKRLEYDKSIMGMLRVDPAS